MANQHVWRRTRSLVLVAAVTAASVGSLPGAAATPTERYIVVFNDFVGDAGATAAEHAVEHGGQVDSVYEHALKGYVGAFRGSEAVKKLSQDQRVRLVERDRRFEVAAQPGFEFPTSGASPWGLDRIDQRTLPLDGSFGYTSTGGGVTVYVIDSGIRYDHSQFGGRAVPGIDTVDRGGDGRDCDGHGTHVAGTIGGATYGVAKGVSLKSVRVLDCRGGGYASDIIRGIDWVTADHQAGVPAVASVSLEGRPSPSVDAAIRRSIADGVSYSIAAGNHSRDACRISPARVREAMVTGAIGRTDRRASWSNYGDCVDWFAPGVGILSASIDSETDRATESGTSMAAPHTAGVAALYLQSHPGASPGEVQSALYELTTKGIVSNAKSASKHLLYGDF